MHDDSSGICTDSIHSGSSSDVETALEQVKDMKERAAYMSEFRCALKFALEEVRTLRTELAEEKSKSLQEISLQNSRSREYKLEVGVETSHDRSTSTDDVNRALATDSSFITDISEDTTLVIMEASSRLDRIRDKVIERNDLITVLRKNLQRSCSLLARREKKLEEKLERESQLRTISDQVTKERDELESKLEVAAQQVQHEQQLSANRDAEIAALRRQLTAAQQEAYFLKDKVQRKDSELQQHRARLTEQHNYLQRKCRECDQLRNQIDWMNYYRECERWEEIAAQEQGTKARGASSYGRGQNSSRRRIDFHSGSARRGSWHEQQHFWTDGTSQRAGKSLSFEQTLSPINEDGEDAKMTTCSETTSNGTDAALHSADAPDVVTSHLGKPAVGGQQEIARTTDKSTNHLVDLPKKQSYQRSIQHDPIPAGTAENKFSSVAKRHDSVDGRQTHGGVSVETHLRQLPKQEITDFISSHAPVLHSTPNRQEYVKSATLPKAVHENKQPAKVRPLDICHAFIHPPSPAPSSVFSTAEDSPSDANTCMSSDSSCTKTTKKNKTKKISHRKSSKHIRFHGHKLDVTDFTMQDFRELMWSACAEDGSADDLLDFLAANARRLQSDPRWRDKHTLGSPEDWLNLKGCY